MPRSHVREGFGSNQPWSAYEQARNGQQPAWGATVGDAIEAACSTFGELVSMSNGRSANTLQWKTEIKYMCQLFTRRSATCSPCPHRNQPGRDPHHQRLSFLAQSALEVADTQQAWIEAEAEYKLTKATDNH
jgi:hypothetical protein